MPTFAYVANDNKVSVIDTNTYKVVDTISVLSSGDLTKVIAVMPDGGFAYVTTLSNMVAVIDTCTNTVVKTIPVGDFPVGIAITPNGNFAYVANSGLATSISGSVSVIDTTTNTVINTIPVGRSPIGIAITPNGNFAYVTNSKSDNVSVIDTTTNTVVNTISVGDFPQGVAITPNGNFAYVANQGQSALSNTVSVININTHVVVNTITVGLGPTHIAITPDGFFAYVTNVGSNTISVISTSTNTVLQSVPVGACPFGIALTPDGQFAYVTNACAHNVSVIDTTLNTVVNSIALEASPLGIAISNINFPCSAPIDRMCIETTRIFDSCSFKVERKEIFSIPQSLPTQSIHCDITATQCNLLTLTKIDGQRDLVDIALQIKVCIDFTSKCFYNYSFKKEVCFHKNISLAVPADADVCCDVTSATCSCMPSNDTLTASCNHNLCCIIKVAVTAKSKKLVQIEVPVLRTCEPKQCSL